MNESTKQIVIAATSNAHTGIHQALASLKAGDVNNAKANIARQIATLANVLSML
jgi:cellobiose-specific phosphotransferase system component IIA